MIRQLIKAGGAMLILIAVLTACADDGRQVFRVENRTGESIDVFLVDPAGTESRVTLALADGGQGTIGFYLRPSEERCTLAHLVARATSDRHVIAERHDWLCIDDAWLVIQPEPSP